MSSSFNNTKRFQDPREIERKKKLTAIGSDLMNSAYDRLIGSQLGKVKGGKVAEKSREEMEQEYKRGLEEGREMAIGGEKKGKGLSEEHLEMARKTGLSGAVIAVMMGEKGGEGEEDSEEKKRKKKDDREKKKKPHKVKKEKRKYKKDKKERSKKKKKSKKEKKKKKKRRKKEYSSSSSSGSSSNDDNQQGEERSVGGSSHFLSSSEDEDAGKSISSGSDGVVYVDT